MTTIKMRGNASGSGSVTLTAPNTNSARTVTFPDEDINLGELSGAGKVGTWVNFNGASPSITNSGNVSSISDVGVGKFYVNYSTAVAYALHATTMSAVTTGFGMQANCSPIASVASTTTSCSVGTGNSINAGFADMINTNVVSIS